VQLALATALFVAAMLLVGSYAKLRTLDVGYPAAHIALAMPMLQHDRYPDAAAQTGFALDVVDHASHESGIDGAAVLGSGAHPRGIPDSVWERRSGSRRLIPDGDSARSVLDRNAQIAVVSDRYFDILHLRTRAGRVFQPSDDAGAELVAVVSARAAEVLWPRQSPIGRRLQVGRDGQPATVIGVVDDTRDLGMNASREQTSTRRVAVYFSTRQVV
jgi:putative ABC transport system permease protein